MSITRRDLLKLGGAGVVGSALIAVPWGSSISAKSASQLDRRLMPVPFARAFRWPSTLVPYSTEPVDGIPTHHYSIKQVQGTARMVPSLDSTVWGYNGLVPGPMIDVDQGTQVKLTVRNKLPATHPLWGTPMSTSVHLHGSASLPQYDGYANDLTPPGFYKTYTYPNLQPARTLWYHDHGVHNTARNVYGGLAAQYHLHDPAERALLPQGAYDVPVTIADAMFAADGQLAYDDRTHSGLWGDVILVNGIPWPVMKVQRRIYRFRFLNASLSRSYRLALSTGDGVTMVATDGGLMPVSRQVGSWRHGPAERYEVLIDFRNYAVGQRVTLDNLGNPNNVGYDHTNKVMAFDIESDYVDDPSAPDPTWNTIPNVLMPSETMSLKATNAIRTRQFRLQRDAAGIWTIGGQRWADVVASGYRTVLANPKLGDTEIWEWRNSGGGWFHPLHMHLVDFKVLTRNGKAPFDYEKGPKDVVYVGESETVRLLVKFGPHRGKYMIHCHNLPHEDHDMMAQFSVGLAPGAVDVNDPITADPCRWDDLPD